MLEQFYKDGMNRLKEQMKKQERERLENVKRQIREDQKMHYEKKLQDAKEARRRELRLIQEELERITGQMSTLKERVDKMIDE
ncbi:MAG: hypothetical protein HFJ10_14425 [Lachnospiraceae bacterium]|nr:hypothetical protein [Lachnospiraceae bacterium]